MLMFETKRFIMETMHVSFATACCIRAWCTIFIIILFMEI